MSRRSRPITVHRRPRTPAALGVSALLAAAAILVSGCQKPLFPPNEPRTQFEVHDRLHNRYTPTEVPDAYGRMRPALRERLSRTR